MEIIKASIRRVYIRTRSTSFAKLHNFVILVSTIIILRQFISLGEEGTHHAKRDLMGLAKNIDRDQRAQSKRSKLVAIGTFFCVSSDNST